MIQTHGHFICKSTVLQLRSHYPIRYLQLDPLVYPGLYSDLEEIYQTKET